jgi:ppGpp synthetase/RelA/SpoT-type nucleotidyltranferase
MSRESLTKFYAPLDGYLKKAEADLWWSLDKFMERATDSEAKRIYSSSRRGERIKTEDSVFRKCLRDEIVLPEAVLDKMEDLVGLRIVASNKKDAETLFDFLRSKKDDWFCETTEIPKFTPYTLAERNGHSIRTGYQAFHVTFVFKRSYRPGTDVDKWPVELQITSQLWEFFAEYSRKYFYSASGDLVERLRPYAVAASRAVDVAEDLVVTTINLLSGRSDSKEGQGSERGADNDSPEGR